MRDILLNALRSHAQGHVDKHKANVEVYLNNTTGIGEHPDIIEAMEGELMEIAKYDDVLEMLEKYFPQTRIEDLWCKRNVRNVGLNCQKADFVQPAE